MRKIMVFTTLAALLCFAGVAHADNAACWGDDSRGDITCNKITEQLLLSLRGQTIEAMRKAFKAPGRSVENGLHFLSSYSRGEKTGSGDVNFTFEDGRATAVSASVDSPDKAGQFEFIWNAYAAPALGNEIDRATKDFRRALFCSDFSGRPAKCQGGDDSIDHQLTLLQMQGSLTKADVLKALEVACNPGQSLAVSDPAGDCARLRERLR
jgi:hypothetical protein